MTSLVVLELQAILRSIVDGIQGLRVNEGGVHTAQFDAFCARQLLVACYRKGKETSHVVGHATSFRRNLEFDGLGNFLEIGCIKQLMITTQVLAKWLGIPILISPRREAQPLARLETGPAILKSST